MHRSPITILSIVGAVALAMLTPMAASAAAPDHAPVAVNQSVTTVENSPISVTVSATDVDGDALTYTPIFFSGCHCNSQGGTVSGTFPNVVFTPTAGFVGVAQFWFQASDGQLSSDSGPQSSWGIVTVNVTAPVVATVPTAKSQCRHGGWKAFPSFKSERACLNFVQKAQKAARAKL
jgi:hypothetical protein